MLFSSLTFLLFFLPAVLLISWIIPRACRNGFLLAASLLFYGWADPIYLLLILFEISVGYLAGRLMDSRTGKARRAILIVSVVLFAGLFVWFKYTDFLIQTFNSLFHTQIGLLKIILPLGISFYTFQIISYVADVYNRKTPVQRSWITFACYVCLFPQLIAGPIVRYSTIAAQLETRQITLPRMGDGLNRFVCGLAKKVLIANPLFGFVQTFRAAQEPSVLYYWLFALALSLYTYFDFSGYSDMAIGLGKTLGFTFPENFNYPFTASTFTDFWRRWHMSLTSWFRDYVYIPLGGNRGSRWIVLRNLLVVWLFTGIWHGAGWTFILWGLGFFVLLALEKFVLPPVLSWPLAIRLFYHGLVLVLLLVSFVLFSDDSLQLFVQDLAGMSGLSGLPLLSPITGYALQNGLVLFGAALIGSTRMPYRLYKWCMKGPLAWLEPLGVTLVLILCLAYLVGGSFNPFLYFRF